MEARKRELVYRACVSGRFPWNTTRATPRAPESTKIAHPGASFVARVTALQPPTPLSARKKERAQPPQPHATDTAASGESAERTQGLRSAGHEPHWSVRVPLSHALARCLSLFRIDPDFAIAGHKAYLGLNSDDCYPVQGHRAFFLIIFKRLQQLYVFISSVGSGHPIPGEYHQVRMPELGFWRSMRRAPAKKNMRFSMLTLLAKKGALKKPEIRLPQTTPRQPGVPIITSSTYATLTHRGT